MVEQNDISTDSRAFKEKKWFEPLLMASQCCVFKAKILFLTSLNMLKHLALCQLSQHNKFGFRTK
jgi:hypothetical protein